MSEAEKRILKNQQIIIIALRVLILHLHTNIDKSDAKDLITTLNRAIDDTTDLILE